MNFFKNKKNIAGHILLLASLPLFFACSDDNPFSNAEGNMEDIRGEAATKFNENEDDYDRHRDEDYNDNDDYDDNDDEYDLLAPAKVPVPLGMIMGITIHQAIAIAPAQ